MNDLSRLADDLRGSVSAFRLPAHMMPAPVAAPVAAPASPGSNGKSANGTNGSRKPQLAGVR